MRLCDLLIKISGDFTVRIYKDNVSVIKEGAIKDLNIEHKKSFNPLEGFDNDLWEKQVKDWTIKDNIVSVLV